MLADGFWPKEYPYPGAKELGDQFYKEHKRDFASIGLFCAQAKILFQAIENASTLDRAKVRKVVPETEWEDTVLGDVKYNEQGYAFIPSVALLW